MFFQNQVVSGMTGVSRLEEVALFAPIDYVNT